MKLITHIALYRFQEYLDCRYLSTVEAVYEIMAFSMHDEYPAVLRLDVHLPGEERIQFDEDAGLSYHKVLPHFYNQNNNYYCYYK